MPPSPSRGERAMRRITATVLACVLVLTLAAPALACINDGDTFRQEHEFRSSYFESTFNENAPDGQPAEVEPSPEARDEWTKAMTYLGAGSALFLCGCFVCLRKPALPRS